MSQKISIKDKIEGLRKKLENMIGADLEVKSEDIIGVSESLDKLILKYILKDKSKFGEGDDT